MSESHAHFYRVVGQVALPFNEIPTAQIKPEDCPGGAPLSRLLRRSLSNFAPNGQDMRVRITPAADPTDNLPTLAFSDPSQGQSSLHVLHESKELLFTEISWENPYTVRIGEAHFVNAKIVQAARLATLRREMPYLDILEDLPVFLELSLGGARYWDSLSYDQLIHILPDQSPSWLKDILHGFSREKYYREAADPVDVHSVYARWSNEGLLLEDIEDSNVKTTIPTEIFAATYKSHEPLAIHLLFDHHSYGTVEGKITL